MEDTQPAQPNAANTDATILSEWSAMVQEPHLRSTSTAATANDLWSSMERTEISPHQLGQPHGFPYCAVQFSNVIDPKTEGLAHRAADN